MKAGTLDRFYNVGTGKRTSLKEIAEKLLHLTSSNQPIKFAPSSQATFVRNRIGAPERAALELGFEAQIALDRGLNELIGWRRAHMGEVAERRDRVS
jgi:UDP-glucose 4-epimerase